MTHKGVQQKRIIYMAKIQINVNHDLRSFDYFLFISLEDLDSHYWLIGWTGQFEILTNSLIFVNAEILLR